MRKEDRTAAAVVWTIVCKIQKALQGLRATTPALALLLIAVDSRMPSNQHLGAGYPISDFVALIEVLLAGNVSGARLLAATSARRDFGFSQP
jgi:hypothetical protein